MGRKPYRCTFDDLSLHCRATCDICDVCEDSSLRFKLVKDSGDRIARDCTWVENRQTRIRCGYDGVDESCPLTCGLCDEEEEDKKNIFE